MPTDVARWCVALDESREGLHRRTVRPGVLRYGLQSGGRRLRLGWANKRWAGSSWCKEDDAVGG